MRVLVVPDRVGDLAAAEVADVVAGAWHDANPGVQVDARPVATGDAGFLAAVARTGHGRLQPLTATDAWGQPTACQLLIDSGAEPVAYLEAAQVAGRRLRNQRAPIGDRGTYGVGELIAAAVDLGIRRVVVGVGPLACLDAGIGAISALAGTAADPDPGALPALVADATARLDGTRLTVATSTDETLLGLQGAAAQGIDGLGLSAPEAQRAERRMGDLVEAGRRAVPDRTDLLTGSPCRRDRQPGAGAGGGLGYGLALLGGEPVSGPAFGARLVRLAEAVADADVVVTATSMFDWHVLQHSVLAEVAGAAGAVGRPVIVLADDVEVGRREIMSAGVSGTYSLAEARRLARGRGPGDLAGQLATLTRRVAGTWTPVWDQDVR